MANKVYKVKQGDCISSIAFKYDLFPETIWDHPDNAELKSKRKDLSVLKPGDELTIPGKELKEESGTTEQKHRFRRKGVPAKFKTRIVMGGLPVDNEDYILEIDGVFFDGKTDETGYIEVTIPPDAGKGKLTIKDEIFDIILGTIDPIEKRSGVIQRLENLGYFLPDESESDNGKESIDEEISEAIKNFQDSVDLEVTGEVDQKTRDKLVEEYGN